MFHDDLFVGIRKNEAEWSNVYFCCFCLLMIHFHLLVIYRYSRSSISKFSNYMKLPQGIKDSDKRLEFQTPPKYRFPNQFKNLLFFQNLYTISREELSTCTKEFGFEGLICIFDGINSHFVQISLWVKIMDSSMFGDQILVGNRYFGCLKKMEAFGYLIFLSREDETTLYVGNHFCLLLQYFECHYSFYQQRM